jgi:hypothetical protein
MWNYLVKWFIFTRKLNSSSDTWVLFTSLYSLNKYLWNKCMYKWKSLRSSDDSAKVIVLLSCRQDSHSGHPDSRSPILSQHLIYFPQWHFNHTNSHSSFESVLRDETPWMEAWRLYLPMGKHAGLIFNWYITEWLHQGWNVKMLLQWVVTAVNSCSPPLRPPKTLAPLPRISTWCNNWNVYTCPSRGLEGPLPSLLSDHTHSWSCLFSWKNTEDSHHKCQVHNLVDTFSRYKA